MIILKMMWLRRNHIMVTDWRVVISLHKTYKNHIKNVYLIIFSHRYFDILILRGKHIILTTEPYYCRAIILYFLRRNNMTFRSNYINYL